MLFPYHIDYRYAMKTCTSILIALLALTLDACVTYYQLPTTSMIKNYRLNQPKSAAPGEAIIRIEGTSPTQSYMALRDYMPPQLDDSGSMYNIPELKKGTYFHVVSHNSDGTVTISSYAYMRVIDKSTSILSEPNNRILSEPNNRSYQAVSVPIKIRITPSGELAESPDGSVWTGGVFFQQMPMTSYKTELNYRGLQGNQIEAVYHDYADGVIDTSRTVVYHYDSTPGTTFTYKFLTIQVIRATDSLLEYKVVSDPTAWNEE